MAERPDNISQPDGLANELANEHVNMLPSDAAASQSPDKPKKKKKKKKQKSLVFPIVLLIMGLVGLAIPVVSDWYAAWQAENTISRMMGAYEPLDDPERLAVKANAEAYNAAMGGYDYNNEYYSGTLLPYEKQLLFKDMTQMSWINIPKVDIRIPVYHSTTEEVLLAGAGHIPTSSLPVGGQTSLCAVTGHSGMRGERMFDDIRKLQNGDVFVIHTLGEPYAYKVFEQQVVLPDDTEALKLRSGRDICVLVTCTPYGVNSHRLLVFGERVEYDPAMEPQVAPLESYINMRTVPLLGAMVALAIALFIVARLRRRANRAALKKAADKQSTISEKNKADAGNGKE